MFNLSNIKVNYKNHVSESSGLGLNNKFETLSDLNNDFSSLLSFNMLGSPLIDNVDKLDNQITTKSENFDNPENVKSLDSLLNVISKSKDSSILSQSEADRLIENFESNINKNEIHNHLHESKNEKLSIPNIATKQTSVIPEKNKELLAVGKFEEHTKEMVIGTDTSFNNNIDKQEKYSPNNSRKNVLFTEMSAINRDFVNNINDKSLIGQHTAKVVKNMESIAPSFIQNEFKHDEKVTKSEKRASKLNMQVLENNEKSINVKLSKPEIVSSDYPSIKNTEKIEIARTDINTKFSDKDVQQVPHNNKIEADGKLIQTNIFQQYIVEKESKSSETNDKSYKPVKLPYNLTMENANSSLKYIKQQGEKNLSKLQPNELNSLNKIPETIKNLVNGSQLKDLSSIPKNDNITEMSTYNPYFVNNINDKSLIGQSAKVVKNMESIAPSFIQNEFKHDEKVTKSEKRASKLNMQVLENNEKSINVKLSKPEIVSSDYPSIKNTEKIEIARTDINTKFSDKDVQQVPHNNKIEADDKLSIPNITMKQTSEIHEKINEILPVSKFEENIEDLKIETKNIVSNNIDEQEKDYPNNSQKNDNNYSQSNNNKQGNLQKEFKHIFDSNTINSTAPVSNKSYIDNLSPNISNTYTTNLEKLNEQISTLIKRNPIEESTTARLNLQPKSLGTLLVEITQSKDNIKIVINAENKEVVSMLEQTISGLKEKLNQQGITNNNIEVNINVQTQLNTFLNKQDSRDESKFTKSDKRNSKISKVGIIDGNSTSNENIGYNKYDSGKFIEKYI